MARVEEINSYLRKTKITENTKITLALLIEVMDGFAKEECDEWKEECERLSKIADFWQKEYYKISGGFEKPKIDNF